jgi:Sulfotransferase family
VLTRRPLFITGMGRSGTMLLGAMVSGHSGISHNSPPFVTNLFDAWSEGADGPERLERFLDDLYGRTRFQSSPLSRDALRDRLRPQLPLSFRDLTAETVAAHSATAGKPDFVYWTDRTPAFVSTLHDNKARFDRILGDYRLVAILRDGRAVLSSALRAQATLGHGFHTDMFDLATHWRARPPRSGPYSPERGATTRCGTRSSSRAPAETLREVCRFLDLPYEPGMLDYPTLKFSSPIHRLLAGPPRPDPIEAWQAEADPRLLRIFDRLARTELHRSGHPPLPPALQRRSPAVLWESLSYWLKTRLHARLRRVLGRARV